MTSTHLAARPEGVRLEGRDQPDGQARGGEEYEERQQPLAPDCSIQIGVLKVVRGYRPYGLSVSGPTIDRATYQAEPVEAAGALASVAMLDRSFQVQRGLWWWV